MKKYMFLCLCLLGRVAFAQTESAVGFKGANTLVLTTADSSSLALREFAECLAVYGVRTRAEAWEPLRIHTPPRALGELSKRAYATYVVTVSPGPNCRIMVTGQVAATGLMNQDVGQAAITGREKGPALAAFRVMENAATLYVRLAKIRKKPARLHYMQQL